MYKLCLQPKKLDDGLLNLEITLSYKSDVRYVTKATTGLGVANVRDIQMRRG
jgi:hypothetical protein